VVTVVDGEAPDGEAPDGEALDGGMGWWLTGTPGVTRYAARSVGVGGTDARG
jgi:hypothetical protein